MLLAFADRLFASQNAGRRPLASGVGFLVAIWLGFKKELFTHHLNEPV